MGSGTSNDETGETGSPSKPTLTTKEGPGNGATTSITVSADKTGGQSGATTNVVGSSTAGISTYQGTGADLKLQLHSVLVSLSAVILFFIV